MKNIVFDMGNVLISFDPRRFIKEYTSLSAEDGDLIMNGVFLAPEWPMLDSGELCEAEMERIVQSRLPERLHTDAHRMIFTWNDPIIPIPGMADLARECKRLGLGVYLLSNASIRQPEYWPDIPGHECFDGTVISALERCVKPGSEIYRRLLTRFGLNPADCLFIDDSQANVDGAIAVGMSGYHFTGDVAATREAIAAFAEWR